MSQASYLYLIKGLLGLSLYFVYFFRILRSGISPKESDAKAWCDRTIRIVGPIMILLVLTLGSTNGWPRR
jgi:hypothetical protein